MQDKWEVTEVFCNYDLPKLEQEKKIKESHNYNSLEQK